MSHGSLGNPVGFIVGEARPQEFTFVTSRQLLPPRLEYLVVPGVEERRDDRVTRVDVLAQVSQISVDSSVLSRDLTYDETEMILQGEFAPPPKVLGVAKVVGYIEDGVVRTPRCSAMPGQHVFVASDEFLSTFFTRNVKAGLRIGTLINRPNVEVALDPNGLRRHLAIIAQTGAGKSYLTGKVLESLIDLGATVLVLDPNSDYVQLRKVADDAERPYAAARKTPFADAVTVYRVPGIQGRRFPDEMVGSTREFTVKFSDLELDEIYLLAGIREGAVRIREAVRKACQVLQAENRDYRPADLVAALSTLREPGASAAVAYIQMLDGYRVWGFEDVPIGELIRPRHITVVDLAGTDKSAAAYVADKALRGIWSLATTGKLPYPVFVVLEEAHNLVPNERGNNPPTRASRIINTIAAEGRKFKVFLIVVTQRPSKIHPDTLSQCGSQFIMRLTNPEDQRAVQQASEAISEDLLRDLPGLNTGKGSEAIVLGQLTRVPVMVRVGPRVSAEGGSDVDLVDVLTRAKDSAGLEQRRRQLSTLRGEVYEAEF